MDRIDFEIVSHLQNDGRISNKTLAGKVGLAPSTCFERVKQLHANGVIRGVHADIDPKVLGVGLEAIYLITLTRHAREQVESFEEAANNTAEVRAVYNVSGQYDYMVHVAVRDTQHLRELAMEAFTIRDEVSRIETVLIFEHNRKFVLPMLSEAKDPKLAND